MRTAAKRRELQQAGGSADSESAVVPLGTASPGLWSWAAGRGCFCCCCGLPARSRSDPSAGPRPGSPCPHSRQPEPDEAETAAALAEPWPLAAAVPVAAGPAPSAPADLAVGPQRRALECRVRLSRRTESPASNSSLGNSVNALRRSLMWSFRKLPALRTSWMSSHAASPMSSSTTSSRGHVGSATATNHRILPSRIG